MPAITTRDGTEISYRDWGEGPPVVLSHGWPLTGDAWEDAMMFLATRGFRVIAHDRRGHGRSSQPSGGNHMDQYADDLAQLIEALDLSLVMLVGHSTGGGEVVRYIGRHGSRRVAKLALVSAVPPIMVETPDLPGGLPRSVFDRLREGLAKDRSQFYRDLSEPFFGANRPGAKVSTGVRDAFWLQSMTGGLKNHYECIAAFSETDFRADLAKIEIPTLVIQGDDDQIVPFAHAGALTAKLVRHARLVVYGGGPHGLAQTHKGRLSSDLLEHAQS